MTHLSNTFYIDGVRVGTVMETMQYNVADGGDAIVTHIPAGEAEVTVPITISNTAEFMEAYRKVFPLTDAEVFNEYIHEGGDVTDLVQMDKLNVISYTVCRKGEGDARAYTLNLVHFADMSIWTMG